VKIFGCHCEQIEAIALFSSTRDCFAKTARNDMLKMRTFYLLGIFAILLSACTSRPAVLGKWRSAPPATLLFEFRSDHSVLLYQDGQVYRVFNYKLLDEDTLQLFDGMGRLRQVDFVIKGNQMLFLNPDRPDEVVEIFDKIASSSKASPSP